MDASADNINIFRQKTGEVFPAGGSEADTMFTDAQITVWLTAASDMNHAVVEGWEAKIAAWASLVDVTDGAASRKLGDLMENAELMLRYYRGRITSGPGEGRIGRTRIGKIVRT